MKKFIGVLLMSALLPYASFCQIVIAGMVVDNATKEALPYATISIKGKPIGVVSNQFGEFTFNLSTQYLKDTLVISMMGYDTYERTIQDIKNMDNLLVPLEIKTIMLNEVVVTGKKLSAKEIIEKA